ncbi:glycerophosphodiester phosphodiesterase family protein [Idiomarina aquatica]|uniref:Glycerophosphodiester phosphodiesterase n=1 Tax=Idiomarina aquatica TaxID=1327752 RepID=A0AA94EG96_9GAMM|nr:glycerophosphodiester phosphodiesterase family protein [Idiomarina aquatica]RUO44503.1 glycerophosphodiester phosphodiesterase [Idiomarina aquatica]
MLKKTVKVMLGVVFLAVLVGVLNAVLLVPDLKKEGYVVAYRGGGSLVDYETLQTTGCTASSLKQSGVNTVENTREAVAASVAAGVDVVHLNVHRTRDNQLVVFHDWTLDCATDGTGPLSESDFADLEQIDAGYGYTSDGGKTFPFRNKGFRISKLSDFYALYPEQIFWLNLKNDDELSFNVLSSHLSSMSSFSRKNTTVITSSAGVRWFDVNAPEVRVASVGSVKSCGIDYLIVGWAGIVPESCKNTLLLIPPSMTNYFWGFPEQLASRMQNHGTEVYLWSKHNAVNPDFVNLINQGVGIVTSDRDFIHSAQID